MKCFLFKNWDLLLRCSRTQFVQRFLIRFLIFICFKLASNYFLLYVLIVRSHFQNFFTSNTHIYINRYIPTIHLKMTEVWSKRRVLPLIFIVKNYFFSEIFGKYEVG